MGWRGIFFFLFFGVYWDSVKEIGVVESLKDMDKQNNSLNWPFYIVFFRQRCTFLHSPGWNLGPRFGSEN